MNRPSNHRHPGPAGVEPPLLTARRILLADDDNTSRRILAGILRARRARVDIVDDGEEAVRRAAAGGYEMILMDRYMPLLDGIGATRRIRGMGGALALLPIIGMTAHDDPDELKTFMEAGLNECITKPIQHAELWRVIGRWMIFSQQDLSPPPASPAPPRQPPLAFIEQGMQKDVISALLDELKLFRTTLVDALDREDLADIRRQAHRICGAAATCGMDPVQQAAERLESGAAEGNRAVVVTQMKKLFGLIDDVVEARRSSA